MRELKDVSEISVMQEVQPEWSGRPGVGAQLRAAREVLGLPLHELAASLKLGVRQLEALENGNWQALPGATFVRGFVRNYARLVHLDPVPLMQQLDTILEKPVMRLGEEEVPHARMPQGGSGVSRRDRAIVLTGGALLGLAALVYFLLPNDLSALRGSMQGLLDSFDRKEAPVVVESADEPAFPPGVTPQQMTSPSEEAPAIAPTPEPPAVQTSIPSEPPVVQANTLPASVSPVVQTKPQASGAAVMRFVFEKESWVEVRDRNENVIYAQRTAAGSEQSFSSDQGPFSLVIGYAPGVKLFWHGQAVDLASHTHGDVARLVLE